MALIHVPRGVNTKRGYAPADIARSAADSAAPWAWQGLVAAFLPALGPLTTIGRRGLPRPQFSEGKETLGKLGPATTWTGSLGSLVSQAHIDAGDHPLYSILTSGTNATVLVVFSTQTNVASQWLCGVNSEWALGLKQGTGSSYVQFSQFGNNSGSAPEIGFGIHAALVTQTAGSGGEIYLDGELYNTYSNTETSADGGEPLSVGGRKTDNAANNEVLRDDLFLTALWSRRVGPAEAKALTTVYFDAFRRRPRPILVPVSVGAGAIGTGTLQAQAATAAGTAAVEPVFTGTGTPQSQPAAAAGTGDQTLFGSGTLQAQGAGTTGTGAEAVGASGTPQAQVATAAGTGTAAKVVSAALVAEAATTAGAGVQTIGGSGALNAQAAAALGVNGGTDSVTASASLQAQPGFMAALLLQSPFGVGSLLLDPAILQGGGRQIIYGAAPSDLDTRPRAQDATLVGGGIARIATSSAAGSGALTAASPQLSVEAEARGPGYGDVHEGTSYIGSLPASVTGSGSSTFYNNGALSAHSSTALGEGLLGRRANGQLQAEEASARATAIVYQAGAPTPGEAQLIAYPRLIADDASSILYFTGPPNRSLAWLLYGSGELQVISDRTDPQGRGYAIYRPGNAGDTINVRVVYGED